MLRSVDQICVFIVLLAFHIDYIFIAVNVPAMSSVWYKFYLPGLKQSIVKNIGVFEIETQWLSRWDVQI
jgi:hypothetical protein